MHKWEKMPKYLCGSERTPKGLYAREVNCPCITSHSEKESRSPSQDVPKCTQANKVHKDKCPSYLVERRQRHHLQAEIYTWLKYAQTKMNLRIYVEAKTMREN